MFDFNVPTRAWRTWMMMYGGRTDYLMWLNAMDVAREVEVKPELVNILVFVLLSSWFLVASHRLLLFLSLFCEVVVLQCCLGHR